MLSSQFESYRVFGVSSVLSAYIRYNWVTGSSTLEVCFVCNRIVNKLVLLYLRASNMRLAEIPPVSPDPSKIGPPK